MTSQDFIRKAWNGDTKATQCSSVFSEGNGTDKVAIYSYGYHYPLLFKVAGKAIRNVRGYSVSTSKHIGWSRVIDAIDVHTFAGFRLKGNDAYTLNDLKQGQTQYVEMLAGLMDAKKRKDTKVYKDLQMRHAEAVCSLEKLCLIK